VRVPVAWLREFVELPTDVGAIADRLAMLGFPVAEIEKRPAITGVVAGRIVTLEKHPNADRLQVAQVDVAGLRPLTIATAAENVAAGQTIAVATVGARLPELTIERRTMRGVASEGMMISPEELALPTAWFEEGIMQLDAMVALGANVVELFGLDTDVLDVEITSNRTDAMSIVGLARELAASYGLPLRLPPLVNPGAGVVPRAQEPQVSIESPDCTRFVAQRFDGIRVGASPTWMRVRLALAGQRPINNLVDVSNYVMLETGQPLHFYDADCVADARLIVRSARDGEKIVTLDGVDRTLTTQALVIADPTRALGLAGLMGGSTSEVTDATTAIILESANFNGARIRRMSKEQGLRTEASTRHEKSLAPALTDVGAARAAQLLVQSGATAYQPRAFGSPIVPANPIRLRVAEVARLLGLAIPVPRIVAHLEALGCEVALESDTELCVTPPAWRRDLSIPADLVEEVARMEGYENIVAIVPSVPAHAISSAPYDLENRTASALAALRYREVITHSLHGAQLFERAASAGLPQGPPAVEVRNPLSEEQRFLRDSLVPGLIEYFATADARVRIFEIGHVFAPGEDGVVERRALAFGFAAESIDEPSWRDSRFLELKGDCETLLREVTGRSTDASVATRTGLHPGKTALVTIDGHEAGTLGRVDPRLTKAYDVKLPVYLCSIDLDALPPHRLPRYRPPSRFPSTYRDLALIVGLDVTAGEIERAIAAALGSICTGARVFDEYRGRQVGTSRKSLAVRITLQRSDATITDEEADAAIAQVIEVVRSRFGATIRE
jgi:phenylalanyl-tRNA synthetase beta chain